MGNYSSCPTLNRQFKRPNARRTLQDKSHVSRYLTASETFSYGTPTKFSFSMIHIIFIPSKKD